MKMRKLAILLLSAFLCSCGFNSVIDDSKDPYINEENNGISIIEIKIDDSSVRSSRSAVPVIGPAETISYSVVAKKGNETIGPVTETAAGLDVYQLQVTPGEWVVSATGTGPTGKDILYGTRTVRVSDSGKYGATVSMQYIMGEGATGGIALTLFINTTKYGVDRMVISGTGTSLDNSYTPASGKIDINKINFPTGDYFPVFKFYNGTNLVCVISERISVRKNRTTKTWIKNGSEVWLTENASGNIEFKITDDVIDSLINHTLFVKGTGGTLTGTTSDSNTGTWAAPLSTVQKAIDKIMLMNDRTSKYTIYVDGEVIDALININGSDLKLDIQGFNGDPAKDILNANKNSGNKAVSISLTANNPDQMYINFSNIKITGGYTSTYNIYVLKPSVVFTNCVIEGNYVNDTSPNGLIFSIAGSITFNNTQVKNNYIKKEVCGAVYALMGATIELTGENYIYDNYAIEANETLTGTQENVIVSSSTAIKILGDITGSKIGVSTTETIQINNPLKFTDNFKASGTTADPSQIFVSDNKYTVGYDPTYSEAAMTVSSYAPTIQMHEDLEIRCLKSRIINPAGCGVSGRTVEFRIYSKTTGEDLTDAATWSITPKFMGQTLIDANNTYCSVTGNKVIFVENIGLEKFNITAIATVHGTTVSTTHDVQIVDMVTVSECAAAPSTGDLVSVSSQADMEKIGEWTEDGNPLRGVNFILQNDVVLSNFKSIGTSNQSGFKFNGNGHTIYIDSFHAESTQSVFSDANSDFVIENVILNRDSALGTLTMTGNGALLVKNSTNATVKNCINRITIDANGNDVAGIVFEVFQGSSKIENCRNEGYILNASSAAGIVYTANSMIGGYIYNCINTGKISTSGSAGGIICVANATDIINCINSGIVTGNDKVGGISSNSYKVSNGYYEKGCIINCKNSGVISGTANSLGGIVAEIGTNSTACSGYYIQNCVNSGVINYTGVGNIPFTYGEIAGKIERKSAGYTEEFLTNNFYLKKSDSTITGLGNTADDAVKTCAFTTNGSVSTTVEAITISSNKYRDVVYLLNNWIKSNTPPTGAPAYSKWTYDSNGLPKLMCEE